MSEVSSLVAESSYSEMKFFLGLIEKCSCHDEVPDC